MRKITSRGQRLVAVAIALVVLAPPATAAAVDRPAAPSMAVAAAEAPDCNPLDEGCTAPEVDYSQLPPCVAEGSPEAVGYEGCIRGDEWADTTVGELALGSYPEVNPGYKKQWPTTSAGETPTHCDQTTEGEGATLYACVEPAGAPTAEELQAMFADEPEIPATEAQARNFAAGSSTGGAATRAATPLLVVKPPAECLKATTKPRTQRLNSCFARTDSVAMLRVANGVTTLIGSYKINQLAYVYTDPRSSQVFNQTSIRVSDKVGVATSGLTLSGRFVCTIYCTGKLGSLPTQPVGSGTIYAIGKLAPAVASGTKANVFSNWSFTFSKAGYSSGTLASKTVTPRCDNNAVASMGKGCVFPDGPVTLVYSKSSTTIGEIARHIGKAQVSGLPSTLTRIAPALATANRRVACPSSLTRPTGKECDEYPFASTVEGGASGGTVRVFDGCGLTIIPGTGPKGFSRCMATAKHNRDAGAMLQKMYHDQRVLVGDKFTVRITA